ncbi:MAG: RNA 2',3'-cyclic phosphodiesterase [Geobacter sp.]|nr:MAG: RNA 2',3'-cyclic phosphodiesterase [Geobacter sp.]
MARLFIAIELPGEIKKTLSSLCCDLPGIRWVPPDQIHLTLRFLGDVQPKEMTRLKEALAAIVFASFPLTVQGVGHFPSHGHPRVLWIGLENSSSLLDLQRRIETAVTGVGIIPEERGFSPHITIARIKENASAAVALFEAKHRQLSFPLFNVHDFMLFSSVLGPKGATHRKEKTFHARIDV